MREGTKKPKEEVIEWETYEDNTEANNKVGLFLFYVLYTMYSKMGDEQVQRSSKEPPKKLSV